MKTSSLLLALVLPATALLADEQSKLVPRPIPGMPALSAPAPVSAPASVAPVMSPGAVQIANPDRARVVYIHRRATLPMELTKDLPVNKATSASPATMLNVRPGAVKIIPKAQVAQIIIPKS